MIKYLIKKENKRFPRGLNWDFIPFKLLKDHTEPGGRSRIEGGEG